MNLFTVFVDHPLIPLFIIANLAIGYWAHRQGKVGSFEDYATASESLSTGVLVMTILAPIVSEREVCYIDVAFQYGGISLILNLVHLIVAALFIGIFLSPQLIYYEEPTLGGVMKRLYGKEVQLLSGIINVVFSVALLISLVSSIGFIPIGRKTLSFR